MSTSIADTLYTALYDGYKQQRASRMREPGDGPKYKDIPNYSFDRALLAAHLDGTDTYAATLGCLGRAKAGCKDYDEASEAEILAALDIAARKGITAVAFLMTDPAGGHTGGHLWTLYDQPYPIADIRAQLRTIPRAGKGEDYPSGNPIRVPFGYHKAKQTRGVLVLQDGRRFDLDDPAGLVAGIAVWLALPRNGQPEPPPIGEIDRASGQAWGDAYKPEQWQNLRSGEALWHSPYVAAVAARPGREPLAALLRGGRAAIQKKDDTIDDSDSAQIAALCYNLLSGNVCEADIRAIALYLYPQLRPHKTLDHYKAHVDAELVRYRPRNYKPQPIRYLGPARQETPAALPPAQHTSRARKDRPQKVAGHLGYLAWLQAQAGADGVLMLSQRECAERLGCNVRTIKRYEQALGDLIEREPYGARQYGRIWVRGDNITPAAIDLTPDDVVIADPVPAQQSAENTEPATIQEEHPAPLPPAPEGLPPRGCSPPSGSVDDDGIDYDEISRMLNAITPDEQRRAMEQERDNPAVLWSKGEARVWHADEQHAPTPEAQRQQTRVQEHKRDQTRARWQKWADAGEWERIGRELGMMRNASRRQSWARWQVAELADLYASRPGRDAGSVPVPAPGVHLRPKFYHEADPPTHDPIGLIARLKEAQHG